MKDGWEVNKLSELCEIKPPKSEAKKKLEDSEMVTFLPMEDLGILNKDVIGTKERKLKDVTGSYTYFANNDVLLAKITPCFENGKLGIARNLTNGIGFGSSEYLVFRSKGKIIQEYLYYYLSREAFRIEGAKRMTGAVGHKRVSKEYIENYLLPYPQSLTEQKRIVAILDEAFAAIDKAKANAERNLKNAREVFESYLQGVFERKSEGWEEQLFENCFKLKSGDGLTSKNMSIDGDYPVFGGNGISGFHDSFNLSGSNVIIGRVGALCGNVRHITESIWLTDNAFKVVDFKFDFDLSFLTYLLNYKNLRSFARQAAQPVISNSSLKDVVLKFPKSLKEQNEIVKNLDSLSIETNKLTSNFKNKIENLEELRKSILQKAFSGELKTNNDLAV